MMRALRQISATIAMLGIGVALALPALADSTTSASGALVRGGASLPRFEPSFPLEIGPPPPSTNLAPNEDLEISLSSPDHGVLHFLFSPRAVSGETFGFGSTVTGNYAGFAWNIFNNNQLFGNIALTGAVNREALDDPTRRLYGPLFSLHSTVELGYSFNAQQSLSLSLDHATPSPYYGNDLRLRYGYHF